jgi:hypothetical protein
VDRYTSERYQYIAEKTGADFREVWIDREKLMEFLKANPDATGVRIYYGVADEKTNEDFKKGIHNLIFVAMHNVKNENRDMLKDNDGVLVMENDPGVPLSNVGGHICPPPPPCSGNLFKYGPKGMHPQEKE